MQLPDQVEKRRIARDERTVPLSTAKSDKKTELWNNSFGKILTLRFSDGLHIRVRHSHTIVMTRIRRNRLSCSTKVILTEGPSGRPVCEILRDILIIPTTLPSGTDCSESSLD